MRVPTCLCKHTGGVQSDKASDPVLVQFLCDAGDKRVHKHRRKFTHVEYDISHAHHQSKENSFCHSYINIL